MYLRIKISSFDKGGFWGRKLELSLLALGIFPSLAANMPSRLAHPILLETQLVLQFLAFRKLDIIFLHTEKLEIKSGAGVT